MVETRPLPIPTTVDNTWSWRALADNILIGGMPGQGKTIAIRAALAHLADLDGGCHTPGCRVWKTQNPTPTTCTCGGDY